MAIKVLVYNDDTNRIETYSRELSDTMPYALPGTLKVGEYRANSTSNTIWTDKRLMECWNILRKSWGQAIPIKYAFKRIWEGGHGYQSEHYAGEALDMAQGLPSNEREAIRQLARDIGCFHYVEPAKLAPTWVHADTRLTPPACSAGFPELKIGDRNTYVIVLQDALNTLGFYAGALDGIFGANTQNAVKQFQSAEYLSSTGVVDCDTWTVLTKMSRGIGRTDTTVD